MLDLYVKQFSFFLTAFCSLFIGFFLLVQNINLYTFSLKLFAFFLTFRALWLFLKKKTFDGKSLIHLCAAFFILFFPKIPLALLPLSIGIYFLILATICILDLYLSVKNHVGNYFFLTLKIFFYFFLGIPLLFSPLWNLKYVLIVLGLYCILFGIYSFFDFLGEVIPVKWKNKMKRHFHITLPIVITTFIPYQFSRQIQKFPKMVKTNSNAYDFEVLIHVSNQGSGTVGHVDFYYDGKIYSYGNYDRKSRVCKEVFGDGVLFITEKKKEYLSFCKTYGHKTLFGFGLRLNDRQKANIDKEIHRLMSDVYEWTPYCKRKENKKKKFNDYTSVLYQTTKATFYKFSRGKFKTFFVLSTNCVQLVDTILGKAGTDIIKMNGIISPGSYYDYFMRQYYKKHSMVVSYQIYS